MSTMAVSSSEAQYIIESCLTNYRIDGRTKLEHRPYTITNRSTKSSKNKTTANTSTSTGDAPPSLILSNGSSRIHLPGSTTDILCSVKADLVHPSSSKPNEGVVELGLDLSLCGGGGTVGGGGGGGSGSSAPKKRRQQRDEESQITSLLQRLVLPHAVNYKRLVIWPGKYVWRLSIDIVVLRCDGCILDACSIAIREALCSTKLPKVQAVMEGGNNNNDSNGGGGGGGGSSKNDLMVDGDFKMATSPAGAQDCPLVITVSVLSAPPTLVAASSGSGGSGSSKKRHRSISIIDARTEEEACAASRVCVSVDPSGMVCGVHTLGGGGVVLLDESENSCGGGQSSSMPLAMLGNVVNSAAMASKNLYELLNGDSEREQDKKTNMKKNVGTVDGDDGCGYGYLLKNHFHIQ